MPTDLHFCSFSSFPNLLEASHGQGGEFRKDQVENRAGVSRTGTEERKNIAAL